ncbi:MAG: tRNA (adenosine(37)-N6)-threonylcarbamoyltransferase complex dimerization subunit type 1 TsaB [Arenibacterium sp.]
MILAFSTSGPYCSVALYSDGDDVAAAHEEMARGQGERLMVMVEEVLEDAQVSYSDVRAIGVDIGPGNFTGIRLSVSAARGLALGLGIPAVGVSVLEALAFGQEGPILASVAAGRDRLYLQRFAEGANKGPELVGLDDVKDWAVPAMTCIGDREDEIAAKLGVQSRLAALNPACAIARIAASRWQDKPDAPAPLYIRAADAAPSRDLPPKILDE